MEYEGDYSRLQTAFLKLQRENQRLKKMLSMENLPTLDILVRDCLKYNHLQLRKIALELRLTDYDSRNVDRVNELIETLQFFCKELNEITETGGYK